MAITDCRVWGITQGAFDGVQRAGSYSVRFQVQTDAVHGVLELLNLCESFTPTMGDDAQQALPKEWSTYDLTVIDANERDKSSFLKRRFARLRDEEHSPLHWWIDLFYERLEPGELPPLDQDGNLIEDPTKWPIYYNVVPFTISRAIDKGIPAEVQVRDVARTDLWGAAGSGGFIEDFEKCPTEPQIDVFVPITNQAGELPGVGSMAMERQNVALPMLTARAYVADLYTVYRDMARAQRTANKSVFFNQQPGFARFRDVQVIGGRRYEFTNRGGETQERVSFYEVLYRWELWGPPPEITKTLDRTTSIDTLASKELPIAAVQIANEGLNAWSQAAPNGNLQPVTLIDSAGNTITANAPWALAQDGTAKSQNAASTDIYRWWYLTPFEYTDLADGKIAKNWPTYDYLGHPARA